MAIRFTDLSERQKEAVVRLLGRGARQAAGSETRRRPPERASETRAAHVPEAVLRARTVPQIFRYWVEATPLAPAVVDRNETVTYRALDRGSSRLAAAIRHHEPAPSEPVGVCVDRGLGSVLAFLATSKTRTAFLPLDPANPPNLNRRIAERAGVRLVITQERWKAAFAGLSCETLLLDEPCSLFVCDERDEPPRCEDVLPSDLAYLMYTSGTTGEPKGVPVSHENYVAYVLAAFAAYEPDVDDRVLQFASQSFDIYMEEIALSVLRGATLVIRDDHSLYGGDAFWSFIEEQRISIVSLPTAFWHALANGRPSEAVFRLRCCIVGGERMDLEQLKRWNRSCRNAVRVFNTYGPTEATCVATVFDCRRLQGDAREIPIGRPLANTRVFVLDDALDPVAAGETGELYLAGASVVDGYFKAAPEECRSFIRDEAVLRRLSPDEKLATLYRTGDLVRVTPDGELIYCGRIDEQVKIRGFRVQPEAVVAALTALPGVAEAAVVTERPSASGQNELFAFVVPVAAGASPMPTGSELRARLARTLPDYMVPRRITVLEALPRTTRNKIDKDALRARIGKEG